MKTIKSFKIVAMSMVAIASAMFTGCTSDDDDLFANYDGNVENPMTRAANATSGVIDFEGASPLAGPTSYGDNLYASYSGAKYTSWSDQKAGATFAINNMNGAINFWNGGIAISNWSIRENGTDHSHDWWYSYLNQCSVYNTSITSGASGAGHSGNNFAIVYGYVDQYNSSYMTYPSITFRASTKVSTVWICNSSYTYGVIKNGNHWDDGEDDGWTGSAKPLNNTFSDGKKGYLTIEAYGFNGSTPTNGGNPVTFDLANYNTSSTGNVIDQWTEWDLSALGSVTTIKFNIVGNDSGTYGLNTPAYFCIDDISYSR